MSHRSYHLVAIAIIVTICLKQSVCFSPSHKNSLIAQQQQTLKALRVCKNDDNADDDYDAHNDMFMMDRRSLVVGSTTAAIMTATATTTGSSLSVAAAATTKIPQWTLEGGVKMPVLALNTVGLSVEESERAVSLAFQEGITHVDFHPGKERDGVARFLANNNKRVRSKMFLNTKIRKAPPGTSPEEAAERTRTQIDEDLKALGLRKVDMLMLRDSPDCDVIQAQWAVLEEALKSGKTRSVGVINFCQSALECVLATATIKPALNYYMLHVGMGVDAHGLRTFAESNGIRTFAYGAVGEPGPNQEIINNNPVLRRIGQAHDLPSAPSLEEQVALRWVLQTGAAASVRPTTNFGLGTSTCSSDSDACQVGLSVRASSFDWALSDAEMLELNGLTSPDDNPTLFSSSGCPGAFVMPSKT